MIRSRSEANRRRPRIARRQWRTPRLASIQYPASGIQYPASSIEYRVSESNQFVSSIDLAFYAGRYMNSIDWEPFFKAAFERNPVSVLYFKDHSLENVYEILMQWSGDSIYGQEQLALPDEVVNFKRGDGIEKAICLANIAKSRHQGSNMRLDFKMQEVDLRIDKQSFKFTSTKELAFNKTVTL